MVSTVDDLQEVIATANETDQIAANFEVVVDVVVATEAVVNETSLNQTTMVRCSRHK